MTVREASEMFHIDEKEVRKNYKDRMIIGATNINGRVYIPDDTTIIPNKKKAFCFKYYKRKIIKIMYFQENYVQIGKHYFV